jgi:hypothetical protein
MVLGVKRRTHNRRKKFINTAKTAKKGKTTGRRASHRNLPPRTTRRRKNKFTYKGGAFNIYTGPQKPVPPTRRPWLEWYEDWDPNEKRAYYVNVTLNKSSWELPPDAILVDQPDMSIDHGWTEITSPETILFVHNPEYDEPVKHLFRRGMTFYNEKTGEITHNRPRNINVIPVNTEQKGHDLHMYLEPNGKWRNVWVRSERTKAFENRRRNEDIHRPRKTYYRESDL